GVRGVVAPGALAPPAGALGDAGVVAVGGTAVGGGAGWAVLAPAAACAVGAASSAASAAASGKAPSRGTTRELRGRGRDIERSILVAAAPRPEHSGERRESVLENRLGRTRGVDHGDALGLRARELLIRRGDRGEEAVPLALEPVGRQRARV